MSYTTRKERKRKKKRRRSFWKFFLFLLFFFVIAIIALGFWGYTEYQQLLKSPDPQSEEVVEVEIPLNSSVSDIAEILEDKGIVQNAHVFHIYTQLNEKSNIQAGYYRLSPSSSVEEVAQQLQDGGSDVAQEGKVTLTIPEGYNMMQIADLIEANTDFTAKEFIDTMEGPAFQEKMLEAYPDLLADLMKVKDETLYPFEGYLYPATYEIYQETTLEDLVASMIKKTNDEMSVYFPDIEQSEYNVHEVLTFASFIEGEANNEKDRKTIAGVFLNRLAINMPLQTDVSVGYAKGEHLEFTTLEDAGIDSPYNLYRHTGLGPGPTNNPSVSSVDAVLHPIDSDYLYFLADIHTQKTYFSKTFEEHLEKQAIYVKQPQEESDETNN